MEKQVNIEVRRKAVFIDKDGTLLHNVPYNVNPDLIRLQEGAVEVLKILKERNYSLILISNQSGVAHGYFTEEALETVKDRIQFMLSDAGIQLDGFYFCPHHPEGIIKKYAVLCSCRKPAPGMILQAASDLQVDLSKSWMVGDILHDVEAGNRVGCRTILIDNGNETEWRMDVNRKPHHIVKSISEVTETILKQSVSYA